MVFRFALVGTLALVAVPENSDSTGIYTLLKKLIR
jgi:hypothetical protein